MIGPCPDEETPPQPQLAERRKLIRFPLQPPLSCLVLSPAGQLVCMAVAQDLSAGGVRLFVRRPFEPGAAFTLELDSRAGTLRLPVPARVAHACDEGGRGFWLGVELAGRLTEEEVRALVS